MTLPLPSLPSPALSLCLSDEVHIDEKQRPHLSIVERTNSHLVESWALFDGFALATMHDKAIELANDEKCAGIKINSLKYILSFFINQNINQNREEALDVEISYSDVSVADLSIMGYSATDDNIDMEMNKTT